MRTHHVSLFKTRCSGNDEVSVVTVLELQLSLSSSVQRIAPATARATLYLLAVIVIIIKAPPHLHHYVCLMTQTVGRCVHVKNRMLRPLSAM